MILTEHLFNANSIATSYQKTQDINNTIPMVGPAFFPNRKLLGNRLDTIKTKKGLSVQLAASNYDAMPTLRVRGTFSGQSNEMPFFRESMLVREYDLNELMKIESENNPYFKDIMASIYDDAGELILGAEMIPEIMRMQLLAPEDGSPKIFILDNNVKYEINYDVDGSYKTNNFVAFTGTDKWDAPDTAKPFENFRAAKLSLAKNGSTPRYALMNQKTFDLLGNIKSVRDVVLTRNIVPTIDMDEETVRRVWQSKTGTQILIYDKARYDKATGATVPYYPDNYVTLLPAGPVGYTNFGTTPEERTLLGDSKVDVKIIGAGIAVAVQREYGPPVKITTTAAEVVLPSYQRMDETFVMKVA